MKNKLLLSDRKSGHSQVKSFNTVLQQIRKQIDIDSFDAQDKDQAEEIALVMAEVMVLSESEKVRINGQEISIQLIQDIYARISNADVLLVIMRYRKVTYEIKHTKKYLRTALYNSVFESRNRIDNEIRAMGMV